MEYLKLLDRETIVKKISVEVYENNGRIEFHGGSYDDGMLVPTNDGNNYHLVNINDDNGHLEVELWSYLTEAFSVPETEIATASLNDILKEILSSK